MRGGALRLAQSWEKGRHPAPQRVLVGAEIEPSYRRACNPMCQRLLP